MRIRLVFIWGQIFYLRRPEKSVRRGTHPFRVQPRCAFPSRLFCASRCNLPLSRFGFPQHRPGSSLGAPVWKVTSGGIGEGEVEERGQSRVHSWPCDHGESLGGTVWISPRSFSAAQPGSWDVAHQRSLSLTEDCSQGQWPLAILACPSARGPNTRL